jgi:hypothetical protein
MENLYAHLEWYLAGVKFPISVTDLENFAREENLTEKRAGRIIFNHFKE